MHRRRRVVVTSARRWHFGSGTYGLCDGPSRSMVQAAQVQLARRLSLEWQAYVVRTHALRKVFVTVKGFHYQVRRRPGSVPVLDAFTTQDLHVEVQTYSPSRPGTSPPTKCT